MVPGKFNAVVQRLRQLIGGGADATDRDLLERFVQTHEEAAFAEIVRRHGPLVLGVARRILGDVHEAEDVFQATFVVLARKASSVAWSALVGNWLHGVARRVALKARTQMLRRRNLERQVPLMQP